MFRAKSTGGTGVPHPTGVSARGGAVQLPPLVRTDGVSLDLVVSRPDPDGAEEADPELEAAEEALGIDRPGKALRTPLEEYPPDTVCRTWSWCRSRDVTRDCGISTQLRHGTAIRRNLPRPIQEEAAEKSEAASQEPERRGHIAEAPAGWEGKAQEEAARRMRLRRLHDAMAERVWQSLRARQARDVASGTLVQRAGHPPQTLYDALLATPTVKTAMAAPSPHTAGMAPASYPT